MNRDELQQLSKDELVELCLSLQSKSGRPGKTSRTSSLPPSTDKKARRENSKPGGAKPGHKAHFRLPTDTPDEIIEHRATHCHRCGQEFASDLPGEVISKHDKIDLPPIKPWVIQHQGLAHTCECSAITNAPMPDAAIGSPFGPRIASMALYLKSFQLFSYQRLQAMFADVFGLTICQGALMNILRRGSDQFSAQHDAIIGDLRQAQCVASDETGMRIEGVNAQQWVFISENAVVHHADYTRKASVVTDMMDGHRPQFWLSDRYAGQQKHGHKHQTCLAHLARDIARVLDVGDEAIGLRLKTWITDVFALAEGLSTFAQSSIDSKVRALEKRIDEIVEWQGPCVDTWAVIRKIKNARDQLFTFVDAPDMIGPTNNISEQALRMSVIQRKVTNGFRSKRGADDDCRLRTVVDTRRRQGKTPYQTIREVLGA